MTDDLLDRVGDGKIHPSSLLTDRDQVELYRREKGDEAASRQVRAARLVARKCVCTPSKVSQRWSDTTKKTTRTIHQPDCPRYKPWMAEGLR